jgi:hypothetical protein
MQCGDWDQLSAPFSAQSVTWRILELAPDGRSARLRPQLSPPALSRRLDEVAGPGGWSLHYRSFDGAVCCELTVCGAVRSAVVEPARENEGLEECSLAALARAAELFGMLPPFDQDGSYWVDYDQDEGLAWTPDIQVEADLPEREAPAPADQPVKPEGQQAIDRLVERLKAEGSGLEAARLLVQYGGYGSDPQAARELYGKLRELLARRAEATA